MSPRPEQFVFMLMSSRLLRAPLKNAKKKCLFSAGYLLANKNEKSEDYSKADLKQRVLFFIRGQKKLGPRPDRSPLGV